jgi:glucoamylase
MGNTGVSRRPAPAREDLEEWLEEERVRATAFLLRNVSPPDALPGAIVASPSRSNPDYYFHWVRDSGIAAKAILSLYRSAEEPAARRRYLGVLLDFADFSRHIQGTSARTSAGLGEPKFTVDGAPYTGPWGRPQNDGPAIRALVLGRLANVLLDEGRWDLVRERLYDGKLPASSVIKADLDGKGSAATSWPRATRARAPTLRGAASTAR